MIIIHDTTDLESTRTSESVCMFLAAALHALMLFWNPTLLASHFKAVHDFVQVDVVDESLPSQPAGELKPKSSPWDTLKDMLMKPKVEEIAHIAPEPVAPKVAAPVQPALKNKELVRPMPSFKPTGSNEDLAAMNSPATIKTPSKTVNIPNNGPSLTQKSFGGIQTKDLPFKMGSPDENIAGGANSTVIPVAVGQKSSKAAFDYSSPALKDSGKQHMGGLSQKLGGASSDLSVTNTAAAPIALSGTGGTGNAPTGASSGASLHNRAGAGAGTLTGRTAYGGGTGTGLGRSGQGIAPEAEELDQKLAASASATTAKSNKKGFDIVGPINNRTITRKVIPQYPSWAEEQGIIGSVRIYFTVTPEGAVRSNMQVRKTTGYPELDKLALEALSQWKFAPVPQSDEGSQWGIITFTFSLAS